MHNAHRHNGKVSVSILDNKNENSSKCSNCVFKSQKLKSQIAPLIVDCSLGHKHILKSCCRLYWYLRRNVLHYQWKLYDKTLSWYWYFKMSLSGFVLIVEMTCDSHSPVCAAWMDIPFLPCSFHVDNNGDARVQVVAEAGTCIDFFFLHKQHLSSIQATRSVGKLLNG